MPQKLPQIYTGIAYITSGLMRILSISSISPPNPPDQVFLPVYIVTAAGTKCDFKAFPLPLFIIFSSYTFICSFSTSSRPATTIVFCIIYTPRIIIKLSGLLTWPSWQAGEWVHPRQVHGPPDFPWVVPLLHHSQSP